MEIKACGKCKKEKSVDDFNNNKKSKDGLQYVCKDCRREYKKEYRKNNKEKIKESSKRYWATVSEKKKADYHKKIKDNPEEYLKRRKSEKERYARLKKEGSEVYKNKLLKTKERREILKNEDPEKYKANLKRIRDYIRKLREEDPERIKQYIENHKPKAKEKRKNNKELFAERQRNYMQSNLQAKLANNLRSRLCNSIKGGVKNGSAVRDLGCSLEIFIDYIEKQFEEGMSWDNWGRKTWHLDHKKPLSSFDLTDREQLKEAVHYTNIQPLWASKNLSKGSKIVL
jgi:hypothetical protein